MFDKITPEELLRCLDIYNYSDFKRVANREPTKEEWQSAGVAVSLETSIDKAPADFVVKCLDRLYEDQHKDAKRLDNKWDPDPLRDDAIAYITREIGRAPTAEELAASRWCEYDGPYGQSLAEEWGYKAVLDWLTGRAYSAENMEQFLDNQWTTHVHLDKCPRSWEIVGKSGEYVADFNFGGSRAASYYLSLIKK